MKGNCMYIFSVRLSTRDFAFQKLVLCYCPNVFLDPVRKIIKLRVVDDTSRLILPRFPSLLA